MQLLQSVTTLILLSFSGGATSSGSSSCLESIFKIAFRACISLVTSILLTLLLTVTTVTNNKKEGIKINISKGYKAVTAIIKIASTVTTL